MGIFDSIKNYTRSKTKKHLLKNWYHVRWDNIRIYREVNPPEREAWKDSFQWKEIERICFEANDLYESDSLYIFIKGREESFTIPTEAEGGSELWMEIIDRSLFDAELAIKAASSDGGLFCWPPVKEEDAGV